MSDIPVIDAEARRRILATVSHTAPFMQAAPPPDPAALREKLRADGAAAVRGMEELSKRLATGRSGWGEPGKRGRGAWLTDKPREVWES